ncbi:hypothetical protein [Asticcacaulis sp. YBE204]|uniref:hypothetical protein n=1 Tax=Asticcacaulis sp. YBE204 TaxID=1282363 RepID=UPI0003C40A05|nr:hypothetical protein [Asticcacaulis sp. YBE204]ESQ78292.1 hypothetical protein AEYBE204_14065 [Asticcacaulis sp. YBE204]
MIRSLLKPLLLSGVAALLCLPLTAQAVEVDKMTGERDPDGKCRDTTSPRFHWQAFANVIPVLGVSGSGTERVEFYGHYMDTVYDDKIYFENLPRATVKRIRGHSGFINNTADCGTKGSLALEITLPVYTSKTNGTLVIDNVRIPFSVSPRHMTDIQWTRDNIDNSSASDMADGATQGTSVPNPAYEAQQRAIAARQARCAGVDPNVANNSGCGPVVVLFVDPYITQTNGYTSRNRTFVRCMDDFGGRSSQPGSGQLRVVLPTNLPTDAFKCFARPFVSDYELTPFRDGNSLFKAESLDPTISLVAPGLPTMVGDAEAGYIRAFFQDPSDVLTMVGEYSYTVRIRYADGRSPTTSPLTVTFVSDPPYGVNQVLPPFVPANGRFNDAVPVIVKPYQRTKSGQSFAWTITGNRAAECFATVTGTLTPNAGVDSFALPLKATDANGCGAITFTAEVLPDALRGQTIQNNRFVARTTFKIPPSQQLQNLPDRKVLPDGVTITRPLQNP